MSEQASSSDTRALFRSHLESHAKIAEQSSPLVTALLRHSAAWMNQTEKGEQQDERSARYVNRLVKFMSGAAGDPASSWVNDYEAALRLNACLHSYLLEDDKRAAGLRPYYKTVGGDTDPLQSSSFGEELLVSLDALGGELFERAGDWKVQTNESSRGLSWLLPAAILEAEAVHLVELGASGGLNLYAEQRAYDLQAGESIVRLGQASEAQFQVKTKGWSLPELDSQYLRGPEVLTRVGIDHSPLDPNHAADRRKLEASVWGDQVQRMKRLREAFEIHQSFQKDSELSAARVLEGELPQDLPGVMDACLPARPRAPVIAFNTVVTTYMSDVDHRAVYRRMEDFARRWTLRHQMPWMWVRYEPSRTGEEAAPHYGWCRWRVELWNGSWHRTVDLGWGHPHFHAVEFGPGLAKLHEISQRS